MQFAEVVLFRHSFGATSKNRIGKARARFEKGLWLGKTYESDEHLCGTSRGVVRVRTIRRLPETDQAEKEMLNGLVGVPWDMGEGRWVGRPRGPQAVPIVMHEAVLPPIAEEKAEAAEPPKETTDETLPEEVPQQAQHFFMGTPGPAAAAEPEMDEQETRVGLKRPADVPLQDLADAAEVARCDPPNARERRSQVCDGCVSGEPARPAGGAAAQGG